MVIQQTICPPDDPWLGNGEDYMGAHNADVHHGGNGGRIDDELPPLMQAFPENMHEKEKKW